MMVGSPLKILQVNSTDIRGGAARISWDLFQAYRSMGYSSWLAVALKESNDPQVHLIQNDNYRSLWTQLCQKLGSKLSLSTGSTIGKKQLGSLISRQLGQPKRYWDIKKGYEDFNFPGTWRLLDLIPEDPDIMHLHNLHGNYFDLRALTWLSKKVPVVITMHDAWLLSGHCAHSFGCERWQSGCGNCPDLTIYPAIRADSTRPNWERKKSIYSKSNLFLVTPCEWLMQKVEKSILTSGIVMKKVIHNGIDVRTFSKIDKRKARDAIGFSNDSQIVLFSANGVLGKKWRNFDMMRSLISQVAAKNNTSNKPLNFIILGQNAPSEQLSKANIINIPYQFDREVVAKYYQASDLYLHISEADTYPTSIIEALSSGVPVVATAVGGIPELIDDGKNGFLVYSNDPDDIAKKIITILSNDELREKMSHYAFQHAQKSFDQMKMRDEYLAFYEECIEFFNKENHE